MDRDALLFVAFAGLAAIFVIAAVIAIIVSFAVGRGDRPDRPRAAERYQLPEFYEPTHLVPPGGLLAWPTPDQAQPSSAALEQGLDVMAVDKRAKGWTRIVCSNGWTGWVDGDRLTAMEPGVEPSAAAVVEPPQA